MCMRLEARTIEPFPDTFYKVYAKSPGYLESPILPYSKKGSLHQAGTHESSRNSAELSSFESVGHNVREGFHVLVTRGEAEWLRQLMDDHWKAEGRKHVVVEVKCAEEDLVGVGQHSGGLGDFKQAVFTKLTITQEEWERVWS